MTAFQQQDCAIANYHLQPKYALISVDSDPEAEIGKDGAGGQNIYVRQLGMALAQRGCQVDMFTRRENPHQSTVIEHTPICRTIRLTAGPTKYIPPEELFNHLPEFVQAWLEFQSQSGHQYSLLHTNSWLSGWVGMQLKSNLGLPQVHTYHAIGAVNDRQQLHLEATPTRLAVERQILEGVDCVIATSPQEEADLRQFVSQEGNIQVIPCGIDTQHFGSTFRTAARVKLAIPIEARVIVYVGRFEPSKGIETLVRACSKLPKLFRLYLIGGSREQRHDSQEQQRIRALVKELGLDKVVFFTGRIPRQQLPTYYAAANVCVVPSDYEPFSLAAIEAMAAGTPVIASNVGGLRHTVMHDQTGLLVPPRNPDALAEAIGQVLTNPLRWQFAGYDAKKWVQNHFSRTSMVSEIQELYESFFEPRGVRQ
ncbi:MAG: glycosyltransferase [Scytonema sp. PMC 1069.18]|nr:glycosyltransferase [Scytonema sp. PMC 1069.18]MEC4884627.1 glycosyltransferase [Scytonema sp. PMC 1070.18]